jgi:uncharacterized coiled-coil DUF342 family protein
MASIKDAQRITDELRSRADELHNNVVDGEVDLTTIVQLADELGAAADRVAATFDKVNDALEQRGEEREQRPRRELTRDLSPARREEQGSDDEESMSREELYERAQNVDIEIPGHPQASDETA